MQYLWKWFGGRPRLDPWEAAEFSPGVEKGPQDGDRRDQYEREVAVEAPGQPEGDGPFARLARAILGYRIFPSSLVTGVLRRDPVEVGDTVGIRYHFLPGLDLFFGARVIERFDERAGGLWRAGFTYRTLRGHPETGDETFCVEKVLETGQVRVALRSWSRAGLFLTRLFLPLTRRIQVRASHAALDHLEGIARSPEVRGRRSGVRKTGHF